MTEEEKKSIFIFYKSNGAFDYDTNIETSWEWLGSGGTSNEKYPREIQFWGKEEDMDKFLDYMINQFDKLVQENKILRYRFSHQYKDIDTI